MPLHLAWNCYNCFIGFFVNKIFRLKSHFENIMTMTLFELLNLTAPTNRKNTLYKVFVLYKQWKFESPARFFFFYLFIFALQPSHQDVF